ncbi:MAG: beta-galactosidase, partial [Verrucomicrobiota bacterium]
MKFRTCFCATLACHLTLVASQGQSGPASTASASDIPHLRKQGTATQLIVDGKPFLALARELSNNGATSREYMKPIWSKLVEAKLNTVLAGVSWAQIEPQEGKFDFRVPDGIIRDARSHHLHLVLLWFASYKNGSSSYPPDWLKKDFERFPRGQVAGGRSIELLSPFSDANRDADARAFAALMRHVKEVDGRQHTVITIQVENEVGMPRDSRDRSPVANQAYAGPVPQELMNYLQQHKDTLIPGFRQVWEAAGFKTSGTWEEVFGRGTPTDEIFMGWNFARYVGRVAEAGKAEYPLPMYMNAWTYGFTKPNQPVQASGSPMPELMDVWRAGAPRIDMFGPDNSTDFVAMSAEYTQSGNPLFIPEESPGAEGAVRALYAFGRHNAICYSRMSGGVDRLTTPDNELSDSYGLLTQLAPLIVEQQGKGTMSAVLLRPD